jgi:alkyl-hydroperoxide reductase/thiol specific antioxidant family protein
VDPLTFLPPHALAVHPPPRPGELAPDLPVALDEGRPAVVAFLRHTGCPFAELTMRMLREASRHSPEVHWIAVSHAPPEATEQWCQALGGVPGVRVASDPSRRAYADWGLGRTGLAHFLGRRSLVAVGSLARRGIRNRHPHGTRWQSAGTFGLDGQGIVRWRLLPAHAGDLPDLDSALRAIT